MKMIMVTQRTKIITVIFYRLFLNIPVFNC